MRISPGQKEEPSWSLFFKQHPIAGIKRQSPISYATQVSGYVSFMIAQSNCSIIRKNLTSLNLFSICFS